MTDPGYDYWDPQVLRVGADQVRQLASKWGKMSEDMKKVADAARGLSLMPTAFAVADPWAGPAVAIDQFLIYNDVHRLLSGLLDGAVVEFAQLQNALRAMADAYEASDQRSFIDLNKIYSTG